MADATTTPLQVQQLLDRLSVLKARKANWMSLFADVARFCNELENPYTREQAQGARKKMPIDITGVLLAQNLASNLFSNTVFQGSEWFSLRLKVGAAPFGDRPVNEWLERVRDVAVALIADSNFVQVFQEMLVNYVVFGTGVFREELDRDKRLVCRQYSISGGVYIDNDDTGRADTVFREFKFNARQAVAAFGYKNVSQTIQKAFDKQEFGQQFDFCEAVYPRKNRDKNKSTKRNRAVASVYIELGEKKVVQESGFDEFPYQIPRFYKIDSEDYGRSPAMFALPTFRLLNQATEAYIKKEEYHAAPIFFLDAGMVDKAVLRPGVINPAPPQMREPYVWDAGGNNDAVILDFIARQTEKCEDLFFKKVFQYLEDRKNMSATEAQLRYEESIQAISPVLSRLQKEFFKGFIERVCKLIVRQELIDVPEAIRDRLDWRNFEVIYATRLDTKLKAVMSANIINCMRLTGEALGILSQNPQIGLYFDEKRIVELIAANNNVSSQILSTEREVEEKREAMAQQQQAAMLQQSIKPIDLQTTPAPNSAMENLLR